MKKVLRSSTMGSQAQQGCEYQITIRCTSSIWRLTDGKWRMVSHQGILDKDDSLIPTAHIFYASHSSWEDNIKDLIRFDELPKLE